MHERVREVCACPAAGVGVGWVHRGAAGLAEDGFTSEIIRVMKVTTGDLKEE